MLYKKGEDQNNSAYVTRKKVYEIAFHFYVSHVAGNVLLLQGKFIHRKIKTGKKKAWAKENPGKRKLRKEYF
jgi:hypothetical protein